MVLSYVNYLLAPQIRVVPLIHAPSHAGALPLLKLKRSAGFEDLLCQRRDVASWCVPQDESPKLIFLAAKRLQSLAETLSCRFKALVLYRYSETGCGAPTQ